jgi:septal ring factor EnvC (AmiA/AmiB activator)
MRALREQPRLVVAKLTVTVAALLATALVAAAIAREDPKAPPDLRPRLERTEKVRRDQTSEIQRLEDQVARLRADLRTATRRARERRRTSERLRRKLIAARRSPAREASR